MSGWVYVHVDLTFRIKVAAGGKGKRWWHYTIYTFLKSIDVPVLSVSCFTSLGLAAVEPSEVLYQGFRKAGEPSLRYNPRDVHCQGLQGLGDAPRVSE